MNRGILAGFLFGLNRDTLVFVNHPERHDGGRVLNQLNVFDNGKLGQLRQFIPELARGEVAERGDLDQPVATRKRHHSFALLFVEA